VTGKPVPFAESKNGVSLRPHAGSSALKLRRYGSTAKCILFASLILSSLVLAQSDPVIYRVAIRGAIDRGLVPYVNRVIDDAEAQEAVAVLMAINTLGGRLDAMIDIRDAILDAKIRVIGYVNKRAISAGALIALACPELYMAPGATIGAATPVDQQGKKVSEKVVSYARAEFRSTAERNNRPAEIAVAMVDENVVIEGVIEKGKLLTLTAGEAVTNKVADGMYNSLDDLLRALNLQTAVIESPKPNWVENVIRVLNHPILSGLLLTIGLLGLITEVISAGWGVPGTAGLAALVLYFGSHFTVGLAGVPELLLIVAGLALIALEVLVIPGFGVAGIVGIACLIAGIVLSMLGRFPTAADISEAVWITIGALIIASIGVVILFRLFEKRPFWSKISLASVQTKDAGFVSSAAGPRVLGQIGTAMTDLRPAGTGLFDNERLDVVTSGEYIDAGEQIKVVKEEGYRRVVERVEK
jgi:membrane-bound serine protease (ClpP class)